MVFRGRGGRPPRGRGFRGRGRGRGFRGRGRGFGSGEYHDDQQHGHDGGHVERHEKRSRSRSRSPKSKRHRDDKPSSGSSSRDKNRRESSRDRDRSRDRERRSDDSRRDRKAHSSEKSRPKAKQRERDRSASPPPHRSSSHGHASKRLTSDRDSYDKKRRSRSRSPPSNRSRGRSPGFRGSPSRQDRDYDDRESSYQGSHDGSNGSEEYYNDRPSGFYDDQEVGRSKWESPERRESPEQDRRDREPPHQGKSEDFQSHTGQQTGPKFRSNKGSSSHLHKTESLRITVGNERFQGKTTEPEDSHKSAMDRLGPPVSQEFQESEDVDDLYQDLPPPVPIPSMPLERKGLANFPIGNTTPLRDETSQKPKEPLKPKSKSGNVRQHPSNTDKEKPRDRGKDRENRSKRSKERDYDDDKAKHRPKDHNKKREETERYSKERDYKAHSRERSYERDRGDQKRSHSGFPPSDRHGKPGQGGPTPVDPALTQATLLVQSIRQSTSSRGDQYPGANGSQPVGGSGGHPPHTGAPSFAQQMPAGGADGMYHQGSQSGYPGAPVGHFPGPPQAPHHHQYQQQPPMQQQQYPHPNQPFQHGNMPPQSYNQPSLNQQQGFPPVRPQGVPSTEYQPFLQVHQGHAIPGMEPRKEEKRVPEVNFGSVDEEDLFLYGDLPDNRKHDTEEKSEPTRQSTSDFWSKRAGPMEEYVPEEKPPPKEEKQPEKPGDTEDDQIKKILSVIGFDFDLAKKIADQKKQQEEEENLRKQARASKKSSVRPQSAEPSQSPQAISSLAGQRENPPPASSFNPSGSFLDSGLQAAGQSGGVDVAQSQQAYEQHERMPIPQHVASQPTTPTTQGASQQGLPPPNQPALLPTPNQPGIPPQQEAPLGYQPLPPLPILYDQYGRPLPPPANLPPQPFQQYHTPPTTQPYFPHQGVPPPNQQGVPPPQGYGLPPSTQPPPQHPYYPDQHGTQYPPHAAAPQQGFDPSFPPTSEASREYQPSQSYQQQRSPERYSRSRSRSRDSSRSSSSGRSESSQSSQSESPERTPPKRSRESGRSHSQSVKDQYEDRGYKEKGKEKSSQRRDDEYGPELPADREGSRSPRRIVLLPKSEQEESSRKRKFKEDKVPGGRSLDKLQDLEKAQLKKLRQLYKDEREALEKKKKKEEEKERVLEEKKLQQALKRKEAERKKEREQDEKKRQAIEKRKKAEEERRLKEDEKERKEEERKRKDEEKKRKMSEAQERARQIKLAQDKHVYSTRLEALESVLARLRKQEGELLRKKQREKAGHRDPILSENNKLQDEIASQLKALRLAYTEGRVQHVRFEENVFKEEIRLREKAFEKQLKEVDARKAKEQDKKSSKSTKAKTDEERAERQPFQFTYTDPGSHWCKLCKLSLQSLNNLFIHLHSKKHMQKCDPYCRPWVPDDISSKKPIKGNNVTAPLGGAEFMMPVNAFYCKLCREFSGDGFCASEHLKSVKHNIKYQKFIEENPGYVKKLDIERAADEKPAEVKEEKKDKNSTDSKEKEEDKAQKKEEDKAKIRVDIGQRGGFGKFRFLKKEGDSSKGESKDERKEVKKEEKNTEEEKKKKTESTIELRKSETAKQHPQNEKEKEKDGVVGKSKEIKINIKLSGRQFVPVSVQKSAPAKVSPVKAKPPPPPPVSAMKSSTKAKAASKIDFKPKDSLDSFLSIGGKGKSLPVIKVVEKKKQSVPSQDEIAAAFSGSKKDAKEKAPSSESEGTSGEDILKPSFSDTLRKMLFTNSQKGNDKPVTEEQDVQEKKSESSFSSIFNTMLSGIQPGIPGIDDSDELKPPGT